MVRVLRAVEVLQVTAHAIGPCCGKIVVGVASRAFQPGMRAGQRKAGEFSVVEFRAQPAIQRVTLLAIRRIADCRVIRVAGLGIVS